MKRSEAFPSNYLKAADIPEEGRVFTVKTVEEEEFKNDGETQNKVIVYFRESEKGLVLNKTNGNTMFDLCGEDTDEWPGKRVKLVTGVTTYQGRTVDCIRVSTKPVPPKKVAPPPVPVAAAEADDDEDDEDSVPF